MKRKWIFVASVVLLAGCDCKLCTSGRYQIVSCGKPNSLAEMHKGYGTCMLDTQTGNFYGTSAALDFPTPHKRWFLIADIEGSQDRQANASKTINDKE